MKKKMKKAKSQKKPKEKPSDPVEPKEKDPFLKLKHIGYCLSQTPPGDDFGLEDFIKYARFFICYRKKILYWDPIWKKYTDEQILIEYYALLFSENKDFKQEFEISIAAPADEDIAWMDEEIEKNQAARKKKKGKKQEPEEFEDTPETLLGD